MSFVLDKSIPTQTTNNSGPGKTLILGIGNLVLSDDGVGVHVAQAMAGMKLPDQVEVLDVGAAFLDIITEVKKASRSIVVDAMQAGGTPGTIYRTMLNHCVSPTHLDTMHGLDISRMFAMANGREPEDVLVFGVEPAKLSWGMDLSPKVAKAIPFVIEQILSEL